MRASIAALLVAVCTTAAGAQTLPHGLVATEIGAPVLHGSASVSPDGLWITAAGTDIWASRDEFTFVHRPMTGDGVIVAQVTTLADVHHWSKAGVMIRESLRADARHAFALVSGERGVAFQRRPRTAGWSSHTDGGSGTAPVWVRLERRGHTFTASRSTDGITWTLIGRDEIPMPDTVHVGLAVTSHHSGARAAAAFAHLRLPGERDPTALPNGWHETLVGAPGVGGSASMESSSLIVRGMGDDIWGTADQLAFVHRPLTGDGAITARVADLEHVHHWSKAGVMIRESLAPNARYAFGLVSGDRGIAWQRRRHTGAPAVHTDGGSGTAPVWVRIERRGSSFTMSRSPNGMTWQVVGTETIAMPATVHVGLAVTSHLAGAMASARFADISVGAATDIGAGHAPVTVSLTSPQAGATYTAPATITLAASVGDPDGRLLRVDFYRDSHLIGSRTAAPHTLTWTGVPAGTYSITAVAYDRDGGMSLSTPRVAEVRDAHRSPGSALFVPSASHDTVTHYELEVYTADADVQRSAPVAVQHLGKPPIVGGECRADIGATIAALPPGRYVAVVTAVAPGGRASSAPSAAFSR